MARAVAASERGALVEGAESSLQATSGTGVCILHGWWGGRGWGGLMSGRGWEVLHRDHFPAAVVSGAQSSTQSASVLHPPSSSPSAADPAAMATATFPEASIQRVTSAGFSREAALEELGRSGGSPELALAALIAKSIKF